MLSSKPKEKKKTGKHKNYAIYQSNSCLSFRTSAMEYLVFMYVCVCVVFVGEKYFSFVLHWGMCESVTMIHLCSQQYVTNNKNSDENKKKKIKRGLVKKWGK